MFGITCGVADLLVVPCKDWEEEKEGGDDGREPTTRTYAEDPANTIFTRGGIAPLKEEHNDLVLDLKTRVATARFDSAFAAFFHPSPSALKDPSPSAFPSGAQQPAKQVNLQLDDVDFSGDVSPSLAATLDRISRKHVSAAAVPQPATNSPTKTQTQTQTQTQAKEVAGKDGETGLTLLPGGGTWDGALIGGKMIGNGRVTYPSGAVYEGNFVESRRNGTGEFRAVDGTTYRGEWLNNCHHGEGTMIFANGDKYTGGWRNDKKHGNGEYVWSKGGCYTGEYSNDVRNGQGRMVYSATKVYEGCYVNDKKHGLGTMVTKGRKQAGMWENDRFSHDVACAGCRDNGGKCGPTTCVLM